MSIVSGTIGRTELSLSALPFGDGNGLSLFIGGLTPGRRTWRRSTASSPFVAGDFETSAVQDQTTDAEFHFRCKAFGPDEVQALVAELVAAVEQTTWDLTFSVGASAWPTLTCTRADSEVIFNVAHTRGSVATVNVFTTHEPPDGYV